jgi:hypothetical protein
MANPRNITSHCLQGQPLPANWRQLAPGAAKQAEQAYLDRIQNAWRNAGSNAQQNLPTMRAARLTNDAADPAHNAHQPRFDGRLVRERTDANGFEEWRDTTTGAIIRRRLTWRDIIGEK